MIADRPKWMDRGACVEHSLVMFFPTRGESTDYAKGVCGRCTVKDLCLQYALDEEIKYGIWGGTSERERRTMRSARRRAEGLPATGPLPGRFTARCGTISGYERHRNEGTPICDACRQAKSAYGAESKRRRREAGKGRAA